MKRRLLMMMLLGACANVQAACGTASCPVNTQWDAQGLSHDEGVRVDLRYTYARANKLRFGSKRVAPEAPAATGLEIENRRTINQLLNADIDYAVNARWKIALGLPLVIRDHAHTLDSTSGIPTPQRAEFTRLGDIRAVGSFSFDLGDSHSGSGVRLGLKLPTGSTTQNMDAQDPADPPGTPYALERSAQPGTGTTDLILGAYYYHELADSPWGWFTSIQGQTALNHHQDFQPGDDVVVDLGTRYAFTRQLTGLLQVNAHYRDRDNGLEAEPTSGGYSLNLSPGLSFAVARQTRIYGFVQLPLYQYVYVDKAEANFGQLTAPWTLSLGISQSF
ncbi:hypothetical protein [Ferrigenium sp. UT5]|uniref:hypothetical protein n=1 Tax=Ferrigenium sp. UT5 TaxID=3242105 RepID=UPI00354D3E59